MTLFPHTAPRKSGFFAQPRAVRLAVYFPVFVVLLLGWVRLLEWKVMHRPVASDGNADWVLPDKGEDG